MSENERDPKDLPALERRAREDLGRMVSATRPEIRARLDALAAEAARAAAKHRQPRAWRTWSIGLCAAAASALIVVMWMPSTAPVAPAPAAADDMALLINVDNLDLLEQMEFYQWLDRDPAVLENASTSGAPR